MKIRILKVNKSKLFYGISFQEKILYRPGF